MEKIVLATNNKHKIKEFSQMFSDKEIIGLSDIVYMDEIEENGNTFLENALIKAKTIYEYLVNRGYHYPVIADDSGLEVSSLNGEPGIYSARYAGNHNYKANRELVIKKLKGKEDKSANFVCCLVKYYGDNKYIHSVGTTYGRIIDHELGDTSFGYDCIFFSDDLHKTFGEATKEEKNSVSHRYRAIKELIRKEKQFNI